MKSYNNFANGKWTKGEGEGTPLFNAITGEEIGRASSKGLDFAEMMDYSRKVGSPKLRKMTFQERGLMLKALALHLHSIKNKWYYHFQIFLSRGVCCLLCVFAINSDSLIIQ